MQSISYENILVTICIYMNINMNFIQSDEVKRLLKRLL